MKQALHKVVSVTMALLLLLSTVSWTVDKHVCMGRVMDIAFFTSAEDCGMQAAIDLLEEEGIENHCCDDESFTIQGQDDLRLSWDDINLNQQSFLVVSEYSYQVLFTPLPRDVCYTKTYPPPLLVYDIQLIDQVFLI